MSTWKHVPHFRVMASVRAGGAMVPMGERKVLGGAFRCCGVDGLGFGGCGCGDGRRASGLLGWWVGKDGMVRSESEEVLGWVS